MLAAIAARFILERVSPGSMFRFAVAALGAFVVISLAIMAWNERYKSGWDDALQSVAQQNLAASVAANKVRITVDSCFDKGGSWNVKDGTCALPQ